VQDGVAPLAEVDEGGLHARQDVLHAAEVDVADHRGLRLLGDVVLDEHAVLEDGDLGAAVALPHDHVAVDGLAAGEELGLGDRRAAPPGVASVAAALTLRLQARGALERGDLVARGAALAGRGRAVVTAAAAAPAATAAGALAVVVGVALVVAVV